jgi:hypothetical protein
LRTKRPIRGREIQRHLEQGITAKAGGVIAVFVASRDHQQPEPDNVRKAMRNLVLCATILDTARQAIRNPKPLLHLAQGQKPAIR